MIAPRPWSVTRIRSEGKPPPGSRICPEMLPKSCPRSSLDHRRDATRTKPTAKRIRRRRNRIGPAWEEPTTLAYLRPRAFAKNRHRGSGRPLSPATVAVGTRVNLAPPAQIRTGRIAAYGSYRRYLALKRMAGRGCRIVALGIHRATSGPKRSQGIRLFWLRRWSARDQCQTTWARKL